MECWARERNMDIVPEPLSFVAGRRVGTILPSLRQCDLRFRSDTVVFYHGRNPKRFFFLRAPARGRIRKGLADSILKSSTAPSRRSQLHRSLLGARSEPRRLTVSILSATASVPTCGRLPGPGLVRRRPGLSRCADRRSVPLSNTSSIECTITRPTFIPNWCRRPPALIPRSPQRSRPGGSTPAPRPPGPSTRPISSHPPNPGPSPASFRITTRSRNLLSAASPTSSLCG